MSIRSKFVSAVLVLFLAASALSIVAASPASAHGTYQNGCSTSPDSGYAPMYFNFHNSCDWHDLCYHYHYYGGGYDGRLACDEGFKTRMRSWCANQYPQWYAYAAKLNCYALAQTYYAAVRTFGGSHF